MSNKKQKLVHDIGFQHTNVVQDATPTLVQRYRFNTVALPGQQQSHKKLALNGAFQGTFAVALRSPHDPVRPQLLEDVIVIDADEDDDEDDQDNPFEQTETSALLNSSPLKTTFENTATTVSIDNGNGTVEFRFSFHNVDGLLPGNSSETIKMVSSRHQLGEMVASRGGYLELDATPTSNGTRSDPIDVENNSLGSTCAGFTVPNRLKLYCVIASAPLPTVTELQMNGLHFRKPDAISFWAFMLGSHARLGKHSPSFLKIDGIRRLVFSYLKFQADFVSLTQRVETWMKNASFDWGNMNARDLVREYRRFLSLKTRAKDWTSQRLSPPCERDATTNFRLLDEGRLVVVVFIIVVFQCLVVGTCVAHAFPQSLF